jgi:hypothetical protein
VFFTSTLSNIFKHFSDPFIYSHNLQWAKIEIDEKSRIITLCSPHFSLEKWTSWRSCQHWWFNHSIKKCEKQRDRQKCSRTLWLFSPLVKLTCNPSFSSSLTILCHNNNNFRWMDTPMVSQSVMLISLKRIFQHTDLLYFYRKYIL